MKIKGNQENLKGVSVLKFSSQKRENGKKIEVPNYKICVLLPFISFLLSLYVTIFF